MTSYRILGALLLLAATGEGFLVFLRGMGTVRAVVSRLPSAIGVGIALVGTWSLLLAMAGVKATALLLAFPGILLPLAMVIRRGGKGAVPPAHPRTERSRWAFPVFIIVGAQVLFVLHSALVRPTYAWDAWTAWSFRAKVLFLEGGFPGDFFLSHWAGSPGYPLGIPLVEAFLAHFVGFWDGPAIKILFPMIYVCTLAMTGELLLRRSGTRGALLGLLLAAPAPLLVHHGTIAYMDLPVAFFFLASTVHISRWEREGRGNELLVGGLLAGFLPQIKNEGLYLYGLLSLVLLVTAFRRRASVRTALLWAAASLPIALPWLLFKLVALPPESTTQSLQWPGFEEGARRAALFAESVARSAFLTGNWGIAWVPLLFLLLPGRRGALGIPGLLLTGGLLLFGAVYVFSESHVWLQTGTTISRNLLILFPLAVVCGITALGFSEDAPPDR
ncbi:MAG: glycosyltransferase family 39 protein [Candidatus Eisenbacteria bacterium]